MNPNMPQSELSASRDFRRPAARVAGVACVVGIAGLAAGVASGYSAGWEVFFRSYLLNYSFVLSLALGALFFVLLQHLVRAGWSVSLRRLAEFAAGTLPVLALLFLPLVIPLWKGMPGVWMWSAPDVVAADPVLQAKAAYLNVPFFLARCAFYFLVWCVLARYYLHQSVAQDTDGQPRRTLAMQWWSAPGMLLYGLTVTFFAIDALMSLNPHWFSTIWGVYFFSGCLVGFFAFLALLVYLIQGRGQLASHITVEHYHDIGKLAFGFVVFWAYIAFSQYMLIWYANIPEETVWYLPRQGDTWWLSVSLLLLFGHFVAPFLALISRGPKRRPGLLALAAVWLLLMHWLDLYYIVTPRPSGFAAPAAPLHLTDLTLFVGLGGLFVAALVWPMTRWSLIPERDPRLPEALAFRNI